MATLNLSSNGPSITKSYESVVNAPPPSGAAASSPTYGQWAVYSVAAPLVSAFQQDAGKESVLKVQSTGEGELVDLIDDFSDGRIQFAFLKIKDPNTTLPKCVLIAWCGEGVPERTKGYFTSHLAAVSKLLHGYHVQVTARSDRDLTPESIVQKVADASGSKYSGGASTASAISGPPPPTVSKPAFQPTRVGGGGSGFNSLGSRSQASASGDQNVDEDGWGADAPQVTRTQLEKVQSAYKPTTVDMNNLMSQRQEPSRFSAPSRSEPSNGSSDIVRGAYQPVGRVDIAAIRRQAQQGASTQDDRPTTVKGAYEPVGKVDIAAIRAKAQGPSGGVASSSTTAPPARSDESEEPPKSLEDRSAAFTQSERLTSLPKPKVSKPFGSSASTFAGTKALLPSSFDSKPNTGITPVGSASRTFADEGGKTPAQIWAEKKARQRGVSGAGENPPAPASPMRSQPSGSAWQSGYSGKSWAPVQTTRTGQSATSSVGQQRTGQDESQEEAPTSPTGGVSAIRDRLKGAAPMGAPSLIHDTTGERETPAPPGPPLMDMSSKPNAGPARRVPMPGLPSRPIPQPSTEPEEADARDEHVDLPTPPAVPRSPTPPTPPTPGSPVRIAMPVARGKSPEPIEAPEERFSPPPMPVHSLNNAISANRDMKNEPQVEQHDPARRAAQAAAATSFGASAVDTAAPGTGVGGKRALIQYNFEKAEDNELELKEGEYVTNIEMVDEDWWMGQNSAGETGLFPSNYVELVGGDEDDGRGAPSVPSMPARAESPPAPAAAPAHAASQGATATAMYDYEAAEDNELSFPDGATITRVEFPDEDWWSGEYRGKTGLFPANYVQLDE
ncbi:hypothetical protein B0A49_12367 [Cryomyces minteri]|uniref:SH3 domain-containing protein n=1 Tax=Cryomyces minteri TaxID=331657 RepID=A0A4U0VJ41_9PEZI|nr:hypothetical protein B0A49_12367 [Cryomyces minteri]